MGNLHILEASHGHGTEARNLSECFGKARPTKVQGHGLHGSSLGLKNRTIVYWNSRFFWLKNHIVFWDIWDSRGWNGQILGRSSVRTVFHFNLGGQWHLQNGRYSPPLWNMKGIFAVGRAWKRKNEAAIPGCRYSMKDAVLLLLPLKLRRASSLAWSPTDFVLEPTWLPTIIFGWAIHCDYTTWSWTWS